MSDDVTGEAVSKDTGDGAGARLGDVGPGVQSMVDAAVEMTFPGSDPVSTTTAAGLRAETEALHQPLACSVAVRRMIGAGLQAAFASESAMQALLAETNPASAALRGGIDRLRSEGEEQLVRLQRALAVFGASANRRVAGTAPPGVASGPLGDLALAFALRVEGHRTLGTYEALEQVASRTELGDVARYMQESVATKRRALDELQRLCAEGLIDDAVRVGGDPLPDPVLHLVFGA